MSENLNNNEKANRYQEYSKKKLAKEKQKSQEEYEELKREDENRQKRLSGQKQSERRYAYDENSPEFNDNNKKRNTINNTNNGGFNNVKNTNKTPVNNNSSVSQQKTNNQVVSPYSPYSDSPHSYSNKKENSKYSGNTQNTHSKPIEKEYKRTYADDAYKQELIDEDAQNYDASRVKDGETGNGDFLQNSIKAVGVANTSQGLSRLEAFTENNYSFSKSLVDRKLRAEQGIDKLQNKKKQLQQMVEGKRLTADEFNEYNYQMAKLDTKIEKLKREERTLETKYVRQTGKDFSGKPSQNVSDFAVKDVNANAARIKELEKEISNMRSVATVGAAERSKEAILRHKVRELEDTKKAYEASIRKSQKVIDWENSASGQFQKQVWRTRQNIGRTVDTVFEKTYISKVDRTISKAINNFDDSLTNNRVTYAVKKVISNGIDVVTAPSRAVKSLLNTGYSKAANAFAKSSVGSAYSHAANAINRSLSNVKSNIANAARATAGKLLHLLLLPIKALFTLIITPPIGWILLVLIAIMIILFSLAYLNAPIPPDYQAVGNQDETLEKEPYTVTTAYRYYVNEIKTDMLEFKKKYHVGVNPIDVASLLTSSYNMDKMYSLREENYKTYIDRKILNHKKAEQAALIFLKEADYHYYYLVREWEDWNIHDDWLVPDNLVPSGDNDLGKTVPYQKADVVKDFDEVDMEYTYTTVIKEVDDPAACDVRYAVMDYPDADDYKYTSTGYVWEYNWYTQQYERVWKSEEVFDEDGFDAAVRRYNDSLRENYNCHMNPKYYGCVKDEPVPGYHWVWKTRNFTSQDWVMADPENPAAVPEEAELIRDTLTRSLGEDSVNDLNAVSDVPSEEIGEWYWFNPLNHADTWLANTDYFVKKEKYWVKWSYAEVEALLAVNYNIFQFEDAPIQPPEHETFHKSVNADGQRVIDLYDTEGIDQGIDVNLDVFFGYLEENGVESSIYEYNMDTEGPNYVVSELDGYKEYFQAIMGANYGVSELGWPMDPSVVAAFTSCAGIRDLISASGSNNHGGDDITATTGKGTQIVSSTDGEVVYVYNGCNSNDAYHKVNGVWQWKPGTPAACKGNFMGGNQVWVKSTIELDGEETEVVVKYLHLLQNSISLNIGDTVQQGDDIGLLGSTGCSTGAHLHFQVDIEATGEHIEPALSLDWSLVSIPPACGYSFKGQ